MKTAEQIVQEIYDTSSPMYNDIGFLVQEIQSYAYKVAENAIDEAAEMACELRTESSHIIYKGITEIKIQTP